MHESPVRQFACENCGAPQQMLHDALVVMCERCGSYVGMQTHRMMDPQRLAKTSAESMRSFAAPTELQARQTEATLRMTAAQGSGDRAQWHLWANEYYTLLSLQPDSTRTPTEPVARAQWLQHCLAVGELTAFDPDMKAVNQRNTDAMVELYQSQTPVESARAVLDASIAVQRYLDQHPDVPALPQTTSAEHRANESLRMLLAVATTTLGAEAVARTRTEVLGDDTVRGDSFPCPGCGGTIEGAHAALACPYCGVVTERAQQKTWLQSSLQHWRAGFEKHRSDHEQAAFALGFVVSSWKTEQHLPEVAQILEFLATGPGWLTAAVLQRTTQSLRQAHWSPSLQQHLGVLHGALADWTPRRPKPDFPGPAPAPIVPPGLVFDATDPWIRQTLALWDLEQQRNPGATPLGTSAVGFVMSPFYAGGALAPEQALAFLKLLRPSPPPNEIVDFARTIRGAGVQPSANDVLDAVIREYGG